MNADGTQASRSSSDLIDLFMEFTDGIPSPDVFRLWSGISLVAGAMRRNHWVETARSKLFPNMYVLLVAPPGVGKSQAITHVSEIWYATKEVRVAPDNLTKAALIDAVKDAKQLVMRENGPVEYHSLLVASSEFGVLVPAHDLEFLNTLNHLYDCPRTYRENRRSFGDNQIDILNPQLTMLGGTQPAYLANLLPEEAWGMGFTARIIMVYSGLPKRVPLFAKTADRSGLFKEIVARTREIAKSFGPMTFNEQAEHLIENWALDGCQPEPTHSKLANYTSRRILHVLKLCMVSAMARGSNEINPDDFDRARNWLLDAELHMPDIFREMVNKSDIRIIEELHFFAWQLYAKDKKPIHEARLIHFLQNRVPSEKIERMLDLCVKANIFDKIPQGQGSLYRPRPKTEHGTA